MRNHIMMIIIALFLCSSIFAQSRAVKKATKKEKNELIKTAFIAEGKYLPKRKVDRFFKKKKGRYMVVDTKQKKGFYFGAVEYDHVHEITFIDKRNLLGDADYYVKKGEIFYKESNHEDAADYFTTAIALGTTDLRARIGKVNLDYSKDIILSRAYLQSINRVGIKDISPYWEKEFYRISLYDLAKQNKIIEAIEFVKKSIALGENSKYDYNNAGILHSRLKTRNGYFSAIPYFKKAIEADSTYKFPYYEIGYAYYNLERYDKALSYFEKVQQLKDKEEYSFPIDDESIYFTGITKFGMDKPDEAIKDLKSYLERQPEGEYKSSAYYFLGLGYGMLENKGEMRKYILESATMGNQKARAFAADYLPGTAWYNNKRQDEMMSQLGPILIGVMAESLKSGYESEGRTLTQEELDNRQRGGYQRGLSGKSY